MSKTGLFLILLVVLLCTCIYWLAGDVAVFGIGVGVVPFIFMSYKKEKK